MASRPPLPELDWEAMEAPEILGALLDAFPGRLQAWRHSKLVTGERIASLLQAGRITAMIDASGTISADGYDLLERELTRTGD